MVLKGHLLIKDISRSLYLNRFIYIYTLNIN